MTHQNRPRITVDPLDNWRLYSPLPLGFNALGVVTRGTDVGALLQSGAGVYVIANAGVLCSLDQRKTAAALRAAGVLPSRRGGAREGAGRPLVDGERHSVTIDAESAAALRALGDGNLSAGIRAAGRLVAQRRGEG